MSEIKLLPLPERFDCTNGNTPWCQGCYTMTPNEYGDYVQWEDYERITAAKDAEIAELVDERDDLLARLDASIDHGTKLGAAQQRCLDEVLEQKAEIEALRAEVEKAKRSVEHTHQWYAVRLEKIKEVAKRVGLWSEVAAIIANGSSSIYDPPTYAQQLNIAKHETKAAEARAERLVEALNDLLTQLEAVGIYIPGQDNGQWAGTEGLSFSAAESAALRDHDQEDKNDGQG